MATAKLAIAPEIPESIRFSFQVPEAVCQSSATARADVSSGLRKDGPIVQI
jgi:hypothetical protein